MGVESMYTNIPHEDSIAACQYFLEKIHMPTTPTLQLIRFILTHNYFSLGYAIYLILNHSYSHINFLDTTIYIKNGTIQTSLYQKPTGRPAHLRCQALRYNQTCLNLDDRNKHLHSLQKTFVNQGYHLQVIDDLINRATQIPRDKILEYKEKTENTRQQMTCKYNLCKDQVAIPNTQKVYTLQGYNSCANMVYMITCTRCSTEGIYIGEKEQKLDTRMNHHRHKIKTKSFDTPVRQHFCNQKLSLLDMNSKGNFKIE
ncbi:hypothetical protein XELAEV_18021152mg [Xenopus laevis]|uniref:GIY-YIG domain-containing protein n=1 Tax=Xenopus laevis TaxID=8355 RepID=A0A974DAX4_XENLA|nr:hypothetical protein XELAEV_18021152mg [Xenopus laevis]